MTDDYFLIEDRLGPAEAMSSAQAPLQIPSMEEGGRCHLGLCSALGATVVVLGLDLGQVLELDLLVEQQATHLGQPLPPRFGLLHTLSLRSHPAANINRIASCHCCCRFALLVKCNAFEVAVSPEFRSRC